MTKPQRSRVIAAALLNAYAPAGLTDAQAGAVLSGLALAALIYQQNPTALEVLGLDLASTRMDSLRPVVDRWLATFPGAENG